MSNESLGRKRDIESIRNWISTVIKQASPSPGGVRVIVGIGLIIIARGAGT